MCGRDLQSLIKAREFVRVMKEARHPVMALLPNGRPPAIARMNVGLRRRGLSNSTRRRAYCGTVINSNT
jgi:hypothetical protein